MPSSRRCDEGLTRRLSRAGFSIVEMIVGGAILLLIMAIGYGMFLWTWRGFIKGDDTITSVYDASVLMLTLRRDLLRTEFPEGQANDIVFIRGGASPQVTALDFQHSTGRIVPSTAAPATPPETSGEETSQLWFTQRWGSDLKAVSYTYYPARRTVKREGGLENETKYFSMPRLRSFELALGLQPRGSPAAAYYPATPLAAAVEPVQLWFQAAVKVRSDRKEGEVEKTTVDVATLIFPKRLNVLLRSRWGK
ncbi:MAG: hypothetical protein HYY25_05155 [Candidatus Wallbacteria bacterium]|nr:hypothetical protein [Candidatus Wallbacteria bacterium]